MTKNSDLSSTEPPRSAQNLASLTDRLQAKIKQDAQSIEATTESEQQQLASSLQTLSASALSTTRNVISQQQVLITEFLTATLDQQKQQAIGLETALTGPQDSVQAVLAQALEMKAQILTEMEALKDDTVRTATRTRKNANAYKAKITKQMKILMSIVAAVCLLALFGIWGYWSLANPFGEDKLMANGKMYKILKGENWTTCTTDKIRPCRPVD